MKAFKTIITSLFLCIAGAAMAQVTNSPAVPQPTTQQDPAVPTTSTDQKTDFNYPQSPNRPANIPSEDTLIKSHQVSAAVIHDSLTPASDKKADKSAKRKNKKGTAEMTDSTSTQDNPARKPQE
jgi:hypothetical protein